MKLIPKRHMDPHVANFGPLKGAEQPATSPPEPPWETEPRPAQLGAQAVEVLHRPVPPRPVHPELHRLRTRPGGRHDASRAPRIQRQQDQVQ